MNRDELARRACKGDVAARDEIGDWLQAELWVFFSRRFQPDVIDDLIQDTMVDVWAKAHREDPASADAFLGWVLSFAGTAGRAANGELKREYARARKLERQPPPEPARSLISELQDRYEQQLLEQGLRRLPTKYRTAVRHRIDGGDDKALAERQGVKEATIRAWVSRGAKLLKRLIRDARMTPQPGS